MQNKIDDSIRPVCSCGSKMQLIRYIGYYEDFNYWKCTNENCKIADVLEFFKTDRMWKGSYV